MNIQMAFTGFLYFRLTMEYGGSDVSRIFYELLKRVGFSPKGVNLASNTDAMLFQELKENLCHLDHVRHELRTVNPTK